MNYAGNQLNAGAAASRSVPSLKEQNVIPAATTAIGLAIEEVENELSMFCSILQPYSSIDEKVSAVEESMPASCKYQDTLNAFLQRLIQIRYVLRSQRERLYL